MSEDEKRPDERPRRSASADAAALRWSEGHPDEEPDLPPPPAATPPDEAPRRSASAEAAALRWSEDHPERPDGDGDD